MEATVAWWLDRDGPRFKRARRTQPVHLKAAALAFAALEGAPGLGGLLRRGSR